MLKAAIGSSNDSNPRQAGKQAALKVKAELDNLKLLFVYASVDYNLTEMLAGIKDTLPNVPILGNTSFTGVVTPEGYITGDQGFLGLMALAGDDLKVGVYGEAKGISARETGKNVAIEAMKHADREYPPDFFYMAAPPGEEELFLKGITDVIGRVPYFGGSAADNSISGDWKLYTDKTLFADGVAVAFFYSESKMTNFFTGAYRETADVGIISKVANNRTLVEIDGQPALKKYAQWRNLDAEELKGGALLAATITSPLGVKDRLGDLIAIRHPMNGNDDYSMAIGANLAENTAVIRMEATVDELIQAATTTLQKLKAKMPGNAAAFHLVHCGGRRAGIGDRLNEVVEAVKKEAGSIPFIMEFTFGEYGFEDDGNNTVGGLMLSYTAFGE